MDKTIIVAIIGAIVTIIGIFIGYLQWSKSHQYKVKSTMPYNKMAAAFKLGYYSVELTFLSKWEKIPHVLDLFKIDLGKCDSLSRLIGIEFPSFQMGEEADKLFSPLHIAIEAVTPEIRSCFRAGMHCGIAYYWRFFVAASKKPSGSLSTQELTDLKDLLAMIDNDIREARRELGNIGLTPKLLNTIQSYLDGLRKKPLTLDDIGQSGNVMEKLINEAAAKLAAQKYD